VIAVAGVGTEANLLQAVKNMDKTTIQKIPFI